MRLAPITSLDGTWMMQPEKSGLDKPKNDKWAEVPVPMPWSTFFAPDSGVKPEMIPDRMAWYRRRFIVPDAPPMSRLLVHFEAVNFFAVVFVNGRRCGQHVGDAIPFEVDITDFVEPRHEAVLLVGVQDISYAESREPDRRTGVPVRKLIYPGLAAHPGIWGSVSLRIVPELHVVNVRVRTEIPAPGAHLVGLEKGRIHVTVAVKNETGRSVSFSLTNEVYDGARQAIAFAPIRGVMSAGEFTEIDMGTSCESAALWWPDEPHLYSLRTALWSASSSGIGDVIDRVHTAVGFREFRIGGGQFLLNNVPIQLRSESVSPTSGELFGELRGARAPAPVAPEQARQIFAALKRTRGINAVRFHRMPPTEALLDAADQTGLMAIVEFPLPDDERRYAVDNPRFWVNTEEMARKWVREHAHHPALVMWSVDQGMVRRYGRHVADGLRSLARAVADADTTRPTENSGDLDLVDTESIGVSSPISVFFPARRVAFRDAGRYAPEQVRSRVLPMPERPTQADLPARRTDRPLCLLEHTRRTLDPESVAFFLGDAAFVPDLDLAHAAAALATLELAACRMARLGAVHTIGRPITPDGTPDAAGDLPLLQRELFANFYVGTRFVENLVLRNDTRFDQDCELSARFTTADGNTIQRDEEFYLAAGAQETKSVAFNLPDVRQVHDADSAQSSLAELYVSVRGSHTGAAEHRRKIAVWPHVRATGERRIGLYDPDGRTAAALSAVGAKYSAAHGAPHGEFDTIIVGDNALEENSLPDIDTIRAFVAGGGLAVFLAQTHLPYDLSPVPLILDSGRDAAITFVRDAEHRCLRGLSAFEMRWWQDDHRVATGCFRKPALGNFRCLVDAGGPGGLRWAAALEVFHGNGSMIFSQIDLVRKAARAPVAGLLLARLADAVPSWRAVAARTYADTGTFAPLGVTGPPLPKDFAADDLDGVQVALLTGGDLARLATAQLRILHEWVQHGRCLYLHNLEPGQEGPLAVITAHDIQLEASPHDRLVFRHPATGLARGLSFADLYYVNHGARLLGGAPRRFHAVTTLAKTRGDVSGVASTMESSLEYALLTLHAGSGRVVIDQVRWDAETAADARCSRYISTLLTNLGVELKPPAGLLPSARCTPVDIRAACNTGLTDPVPGDGDGWTNRGPDNDLAAFAPGLLLAEGVPFRVWDAAENCCVLGGEPAAPAIELNAAATSLAFLVACEGHVKHGTAIAHFTVRYASGLETQIPLRYGVDVLDWNERGRRLDNAAVAWKGFTSCGEPAALYAKRWNNARAGQRISAVVFSSTRAGAVPILLAMTAVE